jgi:hypothetical protein
MLFIKRASLAVFGALLVLSPMAAAHSQSAATSAPAREEALAEPKGTVVLKITGGIAHTNGNNQARLDAAMLDALPQRTLVTKTPWHQGAIRFTGPLLRDVLALVGAKGDKLYAVALNDFTGTIPMADVNEHDVVLAHSINGKRLTVRDKGPLFIIYPFDQKPQLRSSVYYARSVWQLHKLDVR